MQRVALAVLVVFGACRYVPDAAAILDIHLEDAAKHEHVASDHTHGDADDHPKDGDSHCHHDHHCCCQHAPPLGLASAPAGPSVERVETARLCMSTPVERITPRAIFHIPIA